MAMDSMTPSQEDELREVAVKLAEQEHDAEMIATRLRVYAMEWHIHYLETEIIHIAEDAFAARKVLLESGRASQSGIVIERENSDRRKSDRRKSERRAGDRRKRDRRRTGFAGLVADFLRFGQSERRRGERRAGSDRRQTNRRHMFRRRLIRRRANR